MKKVILICTLLIFNSSLGFTQTGWQAQNIFSDSPFVSIDFINNQTGYTYSYVGRVYKTTNRGSQWSDIGYCNPIYTRVSTGYANSDVWYILYTDPGSKFRKSTDFSSWQTVSFPNPPSYPPTYYITLNDVRIINNKGYCLANLNGSAGWVGVYSGLLYHSSNNGNNWSCIYQKFTQVFNDFYIKNENEIGILEKTSIHRTTDGGINWITQSIPNIPSAASSILFSNPFENIILIARSNSSSGKIWRSSNSGATWDSVYTSNTVLNKLYFDNVNNTVFVIGNNGIILKSSDGGLSWQNQNSNTTANLTDIYAFNKDTIFISTSTGQILKTVNGGTVGIQQIGSSIPNKFILHQNYPNPFNPSTKIKFEIPQGDLNNVQLTVYDVSGKEILTLVNQSLSSGVYEVDFNAQNLFSGIYYYKLTSNSLSEVKKMVMIK
ncbi:MAG TPA: T9SS type A sorting domain-containing protein [Ignavibacteria bacterium]|nr:T9SS type A sorting domain-containing protein [Ignavibacteria bacterium]